ncbi:unnamed protein product [Moneuplotes crassus]|uniref:Uncharacterized protein n=1 Tax=Euplotes crassus TaxID=5936 RepID=A0AAD1XCG4_EUPCR|nr:unnamed protein product [Moneuplotes crassus]
MKKFAQRSARPSAASTFVKRNSPNRVRNRDRLKGFQLDLKRVQYALPDISKTTLKNTQKRKYNPANFVKNRERKFPQTIITKDIKDKLYKPRRRINNGCNSPTSVTLRPHVGLIKKNSPTKPKVKPKPSTRFVSPDVTRNEGSCLMMDNNDFNISNTAKKNRKNFNLTNLQLLKKNFKKKSIKKKSILEKALMQHSPGLFINTKHASMVEKQKIRQNNASNYRICSPGQEKQPLLGMKLFYDYKSPKNRKTHPMLSEERYMKKREHKYSDDSDQEDLIKTTDEIGDHPDADLAEFKNDLKRKKKRKKYSIYFNNLCSKPSSGEIARVICRDRREIDQNACTGFKDMLALVNDIRPASNSNNLPQ